jgi:hypothetical protein
MQNAAQSVNRDLRANKNGTHQRKRRNANPGCRETLLRGCSFGECRRRATLIVRLVCRDRAGYLEEPLTPASGSQSPRSPSVLRVQVRVAKKG